jgi:peptidoglycan/xylan/chitin deacetylase (PgdA/CDA1 family)
MGFLSFGKPWKNVILAALVIGVGGYGLFWLRRASAPQVLGLAVREVKTTQRVMALTFDDGPHPQATREILALLKQHDAKATFFVVGQHAQTYPEIIQEIYRDGHELGNHSWDHRHLIYHRPSFVRSQIEATDQLLRHLGYPGPIPFRAPYGHKLFVLPYVLWQSQRPHILWSIELEDWDSPPPAEMLAKFDQEAGPGKILLLHDGCIGQPQSREATTRLLALILEKYRALGYEFVTISGLLKIGGMADG